MTTFTAGPMMRRTLHRDRLRILYPQYLSANTRNRTAVVPEPTYSRVDQTTLAVRATDPASNADTRTHPLTATISSDRVFPPGSDRRRHKRRLTRTAPHAVAARIMNPGVGTKNTASPSLPTRRSVCFVDCIEQDWCAARIGEFDVKRLSHELIPPNRAEAFGSHAKTARRMTGGRMLCLSTSMVRCTLPLALYSTGGRCRIGGGRSAASAPARSAVC